MKSRYEPHKFESAWQDKWESSGIYRTSDTSERPKFYCLDYFPYPSGDGLSVGHCRNYVPTDVISRFKRMRGFNVLHPMGWDAFGLPAENEAIRKRIHPRESTRKYIANYKRQLHLIGTSYDWEREINSSHPGYYKWTQWFFLLLYKRGLAYQALAPSNWCPSCKTVLANEEVEGDTCWRCGSEVTRKDLNQWFFKITDYAEELLAGLETVDWPERIVLMQKNWIGRSEGVEFDLGVVGRGDKIRVFTTRVDTVLGMTFVVLAPEHPLVEALTTPDRKAEVAGYVKQARKQSEIERLAEDRERTGLFIGSFAVNPMNGQEIPIFIGDYVLFTYGTGAIMAVPAHDTRDFDFARKNDLPIPVVIAPPGWDGEPLSEAYVEEGTMVDCGPFSGLPSREGMEAVADYMEEKGIGERKINYRMRDWLISRQRYWGVPIPIVHCGKCGEVPVPESDLPVLLPHLEDFRPTGTGESPLSKVSEFVETTCPECGGQGRRETDTMGGFACSSWYFLRFPNPRYEEGPFVPELANYWLPVDLYVGGAEHAVMHLLYARFWTKVMCDAGLLPFREPFARLVNQGIVHASDGTRMSKSRDNVITPDSIVERHGSDTLRLFELFIGPFDQDVVWSDRGINGMHRFLGRTWDLMLSEPEADGADRDRSQEVRKWLHRTIKVVTEDIERFRFNTALSRIMEFTNYLGRVREEHLETDLWDEVRRNLLLLLAPMTPYLAEELWSRLGYQGSVHTQSWPTWDEDLAARETVTLAVQVNGRVRDKLELPVSTAEEEAKEAALGSERVRAHIGDNTIKRVIFVPDRLINFVVK